MNNTSLHSLSDLISTDELPLLDFFPEQLRTVVFERFYFSSPLVFQDGGNTIIKLQLLYDGSLQFSLPTTEIFSFGLGNLTERFLHMEAVLAVGDDPYLIIRNIGLALTVDRSILKDVASDGNGRITVSADLRFSASGIGVENLQGATLAPATLLDTDIIVEASKILPQFDPMTIEFDDEDEVRFFGVEAETLSVSIPIASLGFPEDARIRLQMRYASITQSGFSGRVQLDSSEFEYPEQSLLHGFPLVFRSVSVDILDNQPLQFAVGIALDLGAIGLGGDANHLLIQAGLGNSNFISAELENPLDINLGAADRTLRLDSFSASGTLDADGFRLQGTADISLLLAPLAIDVEQVQLTYEHREDSDYFKAVLNDVDFGEFGSAETCQIELRLRTDDAGNIEVEELLLHTEYRWDAIQQLLPLADYPDYLPLPPDNGIVEARLHWREHTSATALDLELFTDIEAMDDLWRFIPPRFRPELRRTRLKIVVHYADSADFSSTGGAAGSSSDLSADIQLALPDLNNLAIPQLDLLHVETGNEEGIVNAEFQASYSSTADEGERFQSGLTLSDPFDIGLDIPGGEPGQPLIVMQMDRLGLQFDSGDADDAGDSTFGGRVLLEGSFAFRPLVPAAMPFAETFNSLLHQVGLDEISGQSRLSIEFTEDRFDLAISGRFDSFGIELDIFSMLSSLSNSSQAPEREIDIDFDIGFHLVGFEFELGYDDAQQADSSLDFSMSLTVECSMTGLPPLKAAITLADDEFSFGLENLTIPLEIPEYPIGPDDLDRLQGADALWSFEQRRAFDRQLEARVAAIETRLSKAGLDERERFRLVKDKAHLELKKLMLQLVMEVHRRVGQDGQPVFQKMVAADTWFHHAALGLLHVETEIKLLFPEIKFRIPFDDPSGIAIAGAGKIVGFADNDPLKPLEDYTFSLGLSTEYIFAKIESDGEPIPIPSFGSRYDDGSIAIDKFMIGYGYSKNSFAVDVAGQLVLPSQLIADADTTERFGAGIRLPRYNKLAFRLDLIPVTIVKVTVVIPIPRFDLDLRTPNAPALVGTRRCEPYWDGLELIARDIVHADFKRLAFSPFFGFSITPNLKFDGDLELGDRQNGLTLVADDLLILIGSFVGTYFVPVPFFADPNQPYFKNICANLRVSGFELNFNMQRPFPSASPLAALEAFGLISNPMMRIDPQGELANTIRFTLSDAYLKVPDFVVQMFPEAANLTERTYGFTLNLGTLIGLAQAIFGTGEPIVRALSDYAMGRADDLQALFDNLPQSFDPWDWLAMLPPELRKFRTGGQIAGFEAGACLVIASADEARQGLRDKNRAKAPLPPPNTVEETDPDKQVFTYRRHKNPAYRPSSGHQFESSWVAAGDGGAVWARSVPGIACTPQGQGQHYLIYQKTIPENVELSAAIEFNPLPGEYVVGILLCYTDENNHYLLKTGRDALGRQATCLKKRKNGVSLSLFTEIQNPIDERRVEWKLTSYLTPRGRCFDIQQFYDRPVIDSAGDDSTRAKRTLGLVYDTADHHETGSLGLFTRNTRSATFSAMEVFGVTVKRNNFGRLSQQSLNQGFNLNAGRFAGVDARLIDSDESAMLFKGLEFDKFDDSDLQSIELGPLDHVQDGDSGIYLGAHIKVFEHQRLRFLGRLFADGSFSLVSEAESQPLQLAVAGLPFKLPFSGFGQLILTGRQKRNGYYGQVTARGYFDWSPIPNIVRVIVGSRNQPASLSLYSDGQFSLQADAVVDLFNGAGKMAGQLSIDRERVAMQGRLQYEPGVNVGDYRFRRLFSLDITGVGDIRALDQFRFRGRGELWFLGDRFTDIEVDISERYARFALHFRKAVNTGATDLEHNYPILTQCDIDLRGSCQVHLRRTIRPEFSFDGDGRIRILGAEIKGRGQISALPSPAKSGKHDNFAATMAGELYWQNRKWLGGRLEVGSRGLKLSGTTNLGILLTPDSLPGLNVSLASLYLNIQIEGFFHLDVEKTACRFQFAGHWTLGAAMARDGDNKRQMLPLASSRFNFGSNVDLPAGEDEYSLELLTTSGFSFLPFNEATITIPNIEISGVSGTDILRIGQQRDNENGPWFPAIEATTPLGKLGLVSSLPLPYVLPLDEEKDWGSSSRIYSEYDIDVGTQEISVDLEQMASMSLSLVLRDNLEQGYPIRLKLSAGNHLEYFSL